MSFYFQVILIPSGAYLGLSNDLLEHQGCFSSDVVDILNKWLNMNQKPICLVAHNGNRFDYPILRAEIEKTGNGLCENIMCVDSIEAFKNIDNNKKAVEEKPKQVPMEFSDNFDELLCQASKDFERELEQSRLTPVDVQKFNETTPKKQIISDQTQVQHNRSDPLVPLKRKYTSVR